MKAAKLLNYMLHGVSGRALAFLASMAVNLYLAKWPTTFAAYIVAESIILPASRIAGWGTSVSVLTQAAERPQKDGKNIIFAAGVLLLIASSVTFGVSMLVKDSPLLSSGIAQYTYLFLLCLISRCIYLGVAACLRAFVSVRLANYFSGRMGGAISTVAFFIFLVIPWNATLTIEHVLWRYFYGHSVSCVVGLLILARHTVAQSLTWNWLPIFRSMVAKGGFVTASEFAQGVATNMDIWLLTSTGNIPALAVYGLARKFTSYLVMLSAVLTQSVVKDAAEYHVENRLKDLERSYRICVSGGALAVAAFTIVSPILGWLVMVFMNKPTFTLLPWLMLAMSLIRLLQLSMGNSMLIVRVLNQPKFEILVPLASAILAYAAGVFVVYQQPLLGACLAHAFGLVSMSAFAAWAVWRFGEMRTYIDFATLHPAQFSQKFTKAFRLVRS